MGLAREAAETLSEILFVAVLFAAIFAVALVSEYLLTELAIALESPDDPLLNDIRKYTKYLFIIIDLILVAVYSVRGVIKAVKGK